MMIARYKYAYAKVRSWHVGRGKAAFVAARYAATGDSGRFTSHGGWRVSHLRVADPAERPAGSPSVGPIDEP